MKSSAENDVNDLFIGPHVIRVDKDELTKHDEVAILSIRLFTS